MSPLLTQLIESLRCLPGVGAKTAQRMAFALLERDRDRAAELASTLAEALERIGRCKGCRTLSEEPLCRQCSAADRLDSQLCVVESPADILVIEQATDFRGRYFVLMGRLSPLDGIGPAELGLDAFEARLDEGQVAELIVATNPTIEGEATAHYLGELCRQRGIAVTRLAHGVPLGGELEFIDAGTLAHAFASRRKLA